LGWYGGWIDALEKWYCENIQMDRRTVDNHITTICEDKDNNLWIGTYKESADYPK